MKPAAVAWISKIFGWSRSIEPTLYDTLGGEGTIRALVGTFYDRVLSDATLAPMFNGVDLNRLKRHQGLFISQALGGPRQYDGKDMAEAHRELNITSGQFDQVGSHLRDTLVALGVESEDIGQILSVVASLKDQIVTKTDTAEAEPPPAAEAHHTEAEPAAAPEEPAADARVMYGKHIARLNEEIRLINEPVNESEIGKLFEGRDTSLYQKLGGEGTIKAVVEEFYKRVLADRALAPVFNGVDLNRLKRHQGLFISQALGGPRQYDGRTMLEAHQAFLITSKQFDLVVGHLAETLQHFKADSEDINTILTKISPLKRDIVMDPFARWRRAAK